MKSKNLVICDSEEEYAKALGMFFMRKKELMLQVHVCSNPDSAISVGKEIHADILLADEKNAKEVQEHVKAGAVFILSTGETGGKEIMYPVLYKYQEGEKLLGEIVRECAELFSTDHVVRGAAGRKDQKVIGVFSPVHRIGKTAYALKLGEEMAELKNVLYLNLEIFGGKDGHFEQSRQNMADVLYYARQEKGNLGLMLTTLVCHRGNLDYIGPMPVSEDVKSVDGTEWTKVLKQILEQSIYEILILDIDEGIPKLYQLLRFCTEIHMLMSEDKYSQAKIRHFESELSLLGQEDILQKIVKKSVRKGVRV